tara:strand:- start:436 stop:606 length:171 start_codon:yes stop_codon:yes gene_type:complete
VTRLEELVQKMDRLHDLVLEEGYHGASNTALTRKSPTHYRMLACEQEIEKELERVK